jgi:hypothetical protein
MRALPLSNERVITVYQFVSINVAERQQTSSERPQVCKHKIRVYKNTRQDNPCREKTRVKG